jgi:steroid delta-isomerase
MVKKMIPTIEKYFISLNEIDRLAYLANFGEDAELIDPYGGRPLHGYSGLEKWFKGMEHTWSKFSIKGDQAFVGGDRVAIQWHAEATAKTGKQVSFEGINVFTLDPDGLITRLEAYWDAASVMAQIS